MANYFRNWFLEVGCVYQDLEELFAPVTLQYIQTVGRREPLAFYVWFLILVARVNRLTILFWPVFYGQIIQSIFLMLAALGHPPLPRLPPPPTPSPSSTRRTMPSGESTTPSPSHPASSASSHASSSPTH